MSMTFYPFALAAILPTRRVRLKVAKFHMDNSRRSPRGTYVSLLNDNRRTADPINPDRIVERHHSRRQVILAGNEGGYLTQQ
ncbi:hypothetical protein SPHINGOAX6_70113 [Sphingomonas sp. AX6]|nr:hypothetical protein SPHINGOAX6_70113 [Sphingomonas sp. AX6]